MTYLITLSGVDLNCIDAEGNTALHYAVLNENAGLVYQLLMSLADETIKNSEKLTPYDISLSLPKKKISGLFVS